MSGACRDLHGAQNHGNDQHAVRNELNRRNGIFRMHHPRYQHHTGGNGQHGVIRQGGRVEKRLPKTFAGKDQEKQGGCHGKNGDGIDKTVKPGAV